MKRTQQATNTMKSLIAGTEKFILSQESLTGKKKSLSIKNFSDGLMVRHLLYLNVKEMSLDELIPEESVRGFGGFLLRMSFKSHKRKILKLSRKIRRSLKKAMGSFSNEDFDKTFRYLDKAVSYTRHTLKIIKRLDKKVNTAINTAKTVQIQIQQGRKNM